MITIKITEEVNTKQDMAYLLEHISTLVAQGYRCGYYPTWEIEGHEEEFADEDES